MMKRKSPLGSKIKSYSAMAAAFMAGHQLADAQMVYTDIPDTSGAQQQLPHEIDSYYFLDLNNDGVPDFEVKSNKHLSTNRYTDRVQILGLDSNEVAGRFYNASHFQSGDVINGIEQFRTGTLLLNGYYDHCASYCGGTILGTWDYGKVEYLGLKIQVKGTSYYGWARIKADYHSFVLYDYAYNSTPDSGVSAGAKSAACFIPEPSSIFAGDFCGDTAASFLVSRYIGCTFQWLLNSNLLPGDTSNYFITDTTGNYSAILTSSLGCSDTTSSYYFLKGELPAIHNDGDTLFSNFSSNNQWYFYVVNSGYFLIQGATDSFYIPTNKSLMYSVAHTDANNCTLYSPLFSFIATGISNVEVQGVNMFQDSKNLKIEILNSTLLPSEFYLYDVEGRKVFSGQITNQHIGFDLPGLSPGVYFAIIKNDASGVTRKILWM